MIPIPEFPGYFITKNAEVYSTRPPNGKSCDRTMARPRKLKIGFHGVIRKNGYDARRRGVVLFKDGKPFYLNVAALMLTTFVSPRPKGMEVCHGTLGHLNDSLENLRWGTRKENQQDRRRDSTAPIGEQNPNHVLNSLQVRIIRRAWHSGDIGWDIQYLARTFHVSKSAIKHIITNRTWKHT